MNDPKLRKTGTSRWTAVIMAFCLVALSGGRVVSTWAAEASPTELPVITAQLEYQEVNSSYLNWGPQLSKHSEPFAKEPSWGSDKVVRAFLQIGAGPTNRMALAWDRTTGKLYLDLNGNLDLTDDSQGVFTSRTGASAGSQLFVNARVPLKTATGVRRMLADLSMYEYNRLGCTVMVKSLWQGKVTLQDKEWQVGLLERPWQVDGSLESCDMLLRPWRDHTQPFTSVGESAEVINFPRKLFLDEHGYEVHCKGEGSGEGAKVQVRFKELKPKLGELKIAGSFIRRVTFDGDGYQVVLDNPTGTVKVPVGSYGVARVSLEKGTTQAHLDRGYGQHSARVKISEKAPTSLEAGGPLTNSVTVRRRGNYLSLNYRLTGVGGDYQLNSVDRSHPPEFTVFAGDRKVASGKFEFG